MEDAKTTPDPTVEQLLQLLLKRDAQIEALTAEVQKLTNLLLAERAERFGRKSERIESGQLGLFDDVEEGPVEPEETISPPPAPAPKKQGHGRKPFSKTLPREIVDIDLAETEKCCADCGVAMKSIGIDVCERGHYIPARIKVMRYRMQKYACPHGHGVKAAQAPPALVDRCKYEPSVFAHVASAKYQDHVPLNRLSGIFKRQGIDLPKQTMWDMLVRVDEILAAPVLAQMKKELLDEKVLHGDDTPVPLRVEDGKGSKNARVWAWHSLGAKKAVYDFTLTKERDGPVKFLGDWTGTVILDGASNFNEVVARNGITRAGCWAHARRKLKQAWDRGAKDARGPLRLVQRLFWIERALTRRRDARELAGGAFVELRNRVRKQRSRVVIDRLFEMVGDISLERSTLPGSELGKALNYIANQREPLTVFLDKPEIPIHNNDCERTLRHLVVGRKNWLIFGSPRGGRVACNIYSLVLSCRAVSVDPEAYLRDALQQVSTATDVVSLTPWAWAEQHPEARIELS